MGINENIIIDIIEPNDSFKAIEGIVAKLKTVNETMSQLRQSSEDGFKTTKAQLELLGKEWETIAAESKKRLAQIYDMEQVQKFVQKDLDVKKKGLDLEVAAVRKAEEEKLKAAKKTQEELQKTAKQQNQTQATSNQSGLSGSFIGGVREALQKQTDINGLTAQLGSSLTTTTIDGITTSLNGMIDTLAKGGNAGQAFRQGMGNMLKEMADDLQKNNIGKVLVGSAVEKLRNLFSGSTTKSSTTDSSGSVTPSWSNPYPQYPGLGGDIAGKVADGGLIPPSAGKTQEELQKTAKQNQIQATSAQSGLYGSFIGGVTGALQKQQTDTNGLTAQLGNSLTTTTIDGISTSLNGMVNALAKGGNAWQAFRQGMGNMLQEIAAELQKYIVKMLVVYAVQKLIGLVTSSATPLNNGDLGANNYSGALKIDPMFQAEGGFIPLSAGKTGVDSVPAMLMPGEFVIRKSTVDGLGPDYLHALNEQKLQKFASGGLVGGGRSGAVSGEGSQQTYSLQIVNVADASSIPPQPVDAQQVINIVSFDAAKRGVIHRTIKGVVNG